MLTRIAVSGSLLAIIATLTAPVAPAWAQGVECPDGEVVVINDEQVCVPRVTQTVTTDGGPVLLGEPSGASGGVQTECTRPVGGTPGTGPKTARCYGPGGWYSSTFDCFFQARSHEPPTDGMPGYEEHGDDGLVYRALCWDEQTNPWGLRHWAPNVDAWIGEELVVLAEPPDGYGGTPSMIVQLWVEAINELVMRGPEIVTAPPIDTAGLVHLPVWMWTEVTDNTWREPGDPLHARADGRPQGVNEWVDAFAEPVHIEWDMGDGTTPVPCDAGVAWDTNHDFLDPRDGACTHTYRQSSLREPGGAFDIVAITTWHVWWDINDEFDNEMEIQVGTSTTYQVDEIQVLTR